MDAAKEYAHGGDIYRNPAEYDFSVNINPLGMPAESLQAAQRALLLCGRYPDWRGEALCRAIAEREGVEAEQVILGNGAAELIYALCYFLGPKKALLASPCFAEYEAAVLAAGGEPVFWNLKEEAEFRLTEDVLAAVTEQIGILFLCNPNNPTGSLTDRSLLLKIVEKCEKTNTYFCLDECFLPFLEEEHAWSLKDVLSRYPHLMILRAFTKIYGMPGLRLGYGMTANQELLRGMRSRLQPWNTSIPAQEAGLAALKDMAYLDRTRALVKKEREYLICELQAGLAERVYPSGANFLFFKSRRDLKELLQKQGILIRSCSNYRNLGEGYFRIGIRSHEENRELIRRWRAALEGADAADQTAEDEE